MARYLTEDQAAVDGFLIVHDPENSGFIITHTAEGEPVRSIGYAHYTLSGEPLAEGGADPAAAGTINFDSTLVDDAYRGTGLSGLLAHRAVTDEIVRGRRVLASCWFIDGYLKRHPELLEQAGAVT